MRLDPRAYREMAGAVVEALNHLPAPKRPTIH